MPTNWLEWYWAAWLIGLIVTLAIPEGIALRYGGMTFSSWMWMVTQAWPLWPACWGYLLGGLTVHFWWHWMPPGASSHG